MTRRATKRHPASRAAFWFCVVMAPSWWVLALALTGAGCSFEPSALKGKPKGVLQKHWDDTDGGE